MSTTPTPSPAGAPPPGDTPSSAAAFWRKLVALALVFAPKPLQEAAKHGLLWTALAALVVVFVVPPVVVALAALSLQLLSKPGWQVTDALRDSVVSLVYSAFEIDKRAGSIHRIDYYQALDFRVPPQAGRQDIVSLVPGQHAQLSFSTVKLVPASAKCSLPADKGALLSVRIGGVQVEQLSESDHETPFTIPIDRSFWRKHADRFADGGSTMPLEFRPTPFTFNQCGEVWVKGSLLVFKNVEPLPAREAR